MIRKIISHGFSIPLRRSLHTLAAFREHFLVLALGGVFFAPALAVASIVVTNTPASEADALTIAGAQGNVSIVVDSQDFPVVRLAADLFADDVERVTGHRPEVKNSAAGSSPVIIAGTLGKSPLIQSLIDAGKLTQLDQIKGRWEGTLTQIVAAPFPGVERALIIVGSDRRGTAYGLTQLSEKIGVSPWFWWADAPVSHRDTLTIRLSQPEIDAPAVKYRGIFINDEDWGLFPWASETFDPAFKNIGPKTYAKVYELMLRLRLNYLWPAMHGCSTEFGSVPENYELADKYAIVAGSSHCEPMLCNNIHWDEKEKGRWNYSLNRDTIHSYWEENVKARSSEEAVWTIGIRGIHDQGMQEPPKDIPGRINLMNQVLGDQRDLLSRYVSKEWGQVAQCFIPYKEVLPIYDAGLKVPEDVTLVWVDDNFGYIRRLSSPAERSRAGGSGVYWHLSYYGSPHSYTWINTTAPALMWEELSKAWENEARTLWVINVGDIKPMEVGIDYFSRLAWKPEGFPAAAQRQFLHDFTATTFGEKSAPALTDLLTEFYRIGTVRKPELMERKWALALPAKEAKQLETDYQALLQRERGLAETISPAARDAYTELVGFPVRVLADTGLIFMADRGIQLGTDAAENEKKIAQLRSELEAQVNVFNTGVAGGKWKSMMPGLVTGKILPAWSSQVRWPWGEKPEQASAPSASANSTEPEHTWRAASSADRQTAGEKSRWTAVEGLGPSGKAMAVLPANLAASWKADDAHAPSLEFDFESKGGSADAYIKFLPTFRLYPGMKLRVAISVDESSPTALEVPGSSGAENENGQVRSLGVQNNYVQARVPLPALASGRHSFKIRALDPGVAVDQVALP